MSHCTFSGAPTLWSFLLYSRPKLNYIQVPESSKLSQSLVSLIVLVKMIVVVMKHHEQIQLWEERVCFTHSSLNIKSSEGNKAGTSGQELRQGHEGRGAAY